MNIHPKEIAKFVNLDSSTIRKSYVYREDKANHLWCLQVGTYLAKHNIGETEIVALVEGFMVSRELLAKGFKTR